LSQALDGGYTLRMELGSGPAAPKGDRLYRVCLSLSIASFSLWLLKSWAISNTIRSIGRLSAKLLGW